MQHCFLLCRDDVVIGVNNLATWAAWHSRDILKCFTGKGKVLGLNQNVTSVVRQGKERGYSMSVSI